MKKSNAQRGMSLIEVLLALTIMGLALNVTARAFVNATRLGALNAQVIERGLALVRFEADVVNALREGEAVLAQAGKYRSDATHAVLRVRGEDGVARVAVFGPLEDAEHIARAEFDVDGGELRLRRVVTYALPVSECRFAYGADDPAKARCVTLHYRARPWEGRHAPPQVHEVVAALRGLAGDRP